ncbi:septal ring lytic transglycosylase RlpA family protein [Luteibacter sp. UNCMF366Tsu5.1]|uniref:septal ring lytic transglycosylase RlpA family protein n=1 Tax=Luteibacter sp. UNCMF366Tsu5.1 TaxID=1502758 RepID=UPI000908E4CA|nr:septal ring lytic transglycosylase RlpA family protein [Luteibacter sp. UNCMF366Tsu5.1]SFW55153.1 rare lipoprotein A [Luteibacter sp. UNCMF366Tsu5.1]
MKQGATTPRHARSMCRIVLVVFVLALLTACGGGKNSRPSSRGGGSSPSSSRSYDDIRRSQSSRYRSSSDSVPTAIPDVSKLPEPVPKVEPRALYGNKSPYSVLGQTYTVLPSPRGYVERGIASFYGNKFHGYKTSSLEEYDMYQFSAAHKTLPLPSYARVTNLENGKSVIVRINDRGPFHENRIIDLSFAAAVKIGVWPKGTGLVEVRAIDPTDSALPVGAAIAAKSPRSSEAPVGPTPQPPVGSPVGAAMAARSLQSGKAAATPAPQPPSPRTVATPAAAAAAMPVAKETEGYGDGSVAGMTHVSPAQALPPPPGSTSTVPAASITPPVPGKPSIYLQVGAFSDVANANRVADQLNRAGLGPVSVVETAIGGRSVRRVRVGPLADVDTADRVTDQIAGMGLPRPQVAVD